MNTERIKASIAEILDAAGEEVTREGLANTPDRVARMYENELLVGYNMDPAKVLSRTFTSESSEMVMVKNITFYSLCEHHMLPFFGTVHVGYIPDDRIVGISKIARLVECFTRRLQIQERLVSQIADSMMDHLGAKGVGVVISAEHMCMTMRGIQKPGTQTVTSAMRGMFYDDHRTREEFLRLIGTGV